MNHTKSKYITLNTNTILKPNTLHLTLQHCKTLSWEGFLFEARFYSFSVQTLDGTFVLERGWVQHGEMKNRTEKVFSSSPYAKLNVLFNVIIIHTISHFGIWGVAQLHHSLHYAQWNMTIACPSSRLRAPYPETGYTAYKILANHSISVPRWKHCCGIISCRFLCLDYLYSPGEI